MITLTPEGLLVRRFRRRRSSAERLIKYTELLAHAGADPLPTRDEAFGLAVQSGWMPAVGEAVWLSKEVTVKHSYGIVLSVIPAVPEMIFLVKLGRGRKTKPFERKDLRPAPKRTRRAKPADGTALAFKDQA